MTLTIDAPPDLLPDTVDDGTRREFLAAAVALGLLAGCGDDRGEPGSTTRTIQTDRGPVELPVRPQRLACADFYGSFQAIDLGLTPVGISGGSSDLEPYKSRLKDVATIGDFERPDVEKLAAVRPDVILRTIDTDDALYEQLSKVAPTVEVSFQQLSLTEVTTRVANALNRERQAAELVRRHDQRAAGIRRAYADVLAATRWTQVSPAASGEWFLTSAAWTDNAVLIAAGVRLARAGAAQKEPVKAYSLERMEMIADSDVIVVPAGEDGRTDPTMKEILAADVWQALPAVKRGRSYPLPPGTSSLGMALGLLDALEDVLARLV